LASWAHIVKKNIINTKGKTGSHTRTRTPRDTQVQVACQIFAKWKN
jgi:hypothetical protein